MGLQTGQKYSFPYGYGPPLTHTAGPVPATLLFSDSGSLGEILVICTIIFTLELIPTIFMVKACRERSLQQVLRLRELGLLLLTDKRRRSLLIRKWRPQAPSRAISGVCLNPYSGALLPRSLRGRERVNGGIWCHKNVHRVHRGCLATGCRMKPHTTLTGIAFRGRSHLTWCTMSSEMTPKLAI